VLEPLEPQDNSSLSFSEAPNFWNRSAVLRRSSSDMREWVFGHLLPSIAWGVIGGFISMLLGVNTQVWIGITGFLITYVLVPVGMFGYFFIHAPAKLLDEKDGQISDLELEIKTLKRLLAPPAYTLKVETGNCAPFIDKSLEQYDPKSYPQEFQIVRIAISSVGTERIENVSAELEDVPNKLGMSFSGIPLRHKDSVNRKQTSFTVFPNKPEYVDIATYPTDAWLDTILGKQMRAIHLCHESKYHFTLNPKIKNEITLIVYGDVESRKYDFYLYVDDEKLYLEPIS